MFVIRYLGFPHLPNVVAKLSCQLFRHSVLAHRSEGGSEGDALEHLTHVEDAYVIIKRRSEQLGIWAPAKLLHDHRLTLLILVTRLAAPRSYAHHAVVSARLLGAAPLVMFYHCAEAALAE